MYLLCIAMSCCHVMLCCHVAMLPNSRLADIHPPKVPRRSDDAKSLIRWMLKMNPRDRYTAEHRPHEEQALECQEMLSLALEKLYTDIC